MTSIAVLREANLLDVEVTAICDSDSETLRAAAEFFDVPKKCAAYNELVNSNDVDVVYVCTPTNLHPEMVEAVVKVGKPVFCEKPLAHTYVQASSLMAAARRARVPTGIGLVLRFDQFLLYAKHLIEIRELGRPMLAHIRTISGCLLVFCTTVSGAATSRLLGVAR